MRVADRRDARVGDRLLVPAGERAAHGLVQHRVAAHAPEHDLRRDLALPEPRDLQVAPDGAGGGSELLLERLGRDLDLDAYARVA